MTGRTQTWADGCLASVSVGQVTELSCHISWAAVVVVLALMLNFVVLLGLLVIPSWEQSEFCSQRLQQYSCCGRGWVIVVLAGNFLLAMNFWSILFEAQFLCNQPGLWTKEHASELHEKALADYPVGFAQFIVALLKCLCVEALLNSAVDKFGREKGGWGAGMCLLRYSLAVF